MSSTTNSQVDKFLSEFNQLKSDIETNITSATSIDCQQDGSLTTKLQKLERLLNEQAAYLPPYTCKVSQESLDSIRRQINEKRGTETTKKKFTFGKNRPATNVTTAPVTTIFGDQPSDQEESKKENVVISSKLGINNLNGQSLTIEREQFHDKDFELDSMVNCVINMPGSPVTLFLRNLTNCSINCGPVSSSVYVDSCKDCTFSLAFQQLRIHTSTNCKFYVNAKTKPIIEDCKSMYFGQYNYKYDELQSDLNTCGFTPETENLYMQVVDFNWLSSEPSPNWSVL